MKFPILKKGFNRLASLAAILVFSVATLPQGEAAEVGLSLQQIAGTSPLVTVAAVVISGQIVEGDAKKVEDLLAEINRTDDGHLIRRLLIHSPGGLVGEAITIGRLLRTNGVEVFLPRQTSCVSACVLILAGGSNRIIDGKVGIDYPHFLRPAGPGDNVPALLAEIRQVMRDYFLSMDVEEGLADAMFSVPEGDVHYLTQEELSRYRLTGAR